MKKEGKEKEKTYTYNISKWPGRTEKDDDANRFAEGNKKEKKM